MLFAETGKQFGQNFARKEEKNISKVQITYCNKNLQNSRFRFQCMFIIKTFPHQQILK